MSEIEPVQEARIDRGCCRIVTIGRRVSRIDGAPIGQRGSYWFRVRYIDHDAETGDYFLRSGAPGVGDSIKVLHLTSPHHKSPIGRRRQFSD